MVLRPLFPRLCASFAALAMAQTVAAPPAAQEVVFDFRPRIVLPGAKKDKEEKENDAAARKKASVHLHVYRQGRDAKECNGDERVPVAPDNRVGVVLSGGISKGLAFVGALQVLDEAEIRIDSIAGTSMGAVVGAFYAAGYAPTDLYSAANGSQRDLTSDADILGGIDWLTMFTDVPDPRVLTVNQHTAWGLGGGTLPLPRVYQGGLRSGQNLSAFLGKYLLAGSAASDGCFDNLYVPFRAKATDISQSRSRTLRKGELATAVRASLSFPVLFTPTPWRGSRLLDGGLLNNYPVDAILQDEDGDIESLRKPTRGVHAPATAASAAPQGQIPPPKPRPTPFRALFGIDVSDTKPPVVPAPSRLQLLSIFDAVTGISDGIGTGISRETKRQLGQHEDCAPRAQLGKDPVPHEPCLFNVKIEREGGFTDFTPDRIALFVQSGRDETIAALCDWFVPKGSSACARHAATIVAASGQRWRQPAEAWRAEIEGKAIAEVKRAIEGQKDKPSPWRFLLHSPVLSMQEASKALGGLETSPDLAGIRRLERALATSDLGSTGPDTESPWAHALQGLELRLGASGQLQIRASNLVNQEPALRSALLEVARNTLCWMVMELNAPGCVAGSVPRLPNGKHVSGVRVVSRQDEVLVRVSTWAYDVAGVVATRNFVQVDLLDEVRIAYWGKDPGTIGRRGADLYDPPKAWQLQPRGEPQVDCLPKVPGRESPGCVWKKELADALLGKAYDVRYFDGAQPGCQGKDCAGRPSLAQAFERLQARYYANVSAEHFRIEGIRPDALELAEKDTHRVEQIALHGGYHYDYRNKHSLSLRLVHETRQDDWYKPARTILTAMVNEPVTNADGMAFVDSTALYMPSLKTGSFDLSVTARIARRDQRIGDGQIRLGYDEAGWIVTTGMRPDDADPPKERLEPRPGRAGTSADRVAPYLSYAYRRLGDIRTSDPEALKQRLRSPDLNPAWQRMESWTLGVRATRQRTYFTGLADAEATAHHRQGAWFTELFFDGHLEYKWGLRDEDGVAGLRFVAGKIWSRGSPGPDGQRPAPPVDQLYSLGGHYPLVDRRIWGRKRIDYLGADLNERWGDQVALLEGRQSLWNLPAVAYFAPFSKLRVDAVLQVSRIGFSGDERRPVRTAKGLVATAYLPALAAYKVRGTAGIGGESTKDTRFFASFELLF